MIDSGVNGLSAEIEDVNRRMSHFDPVLRAGGRIAGQTRVWLIEHTTHGYSYKQSV